jgi:PAS domain S-box-containing protein
MQRQVEKANPELFQALFNNAAIGIIMVNASGVIELTNHFAETQFGYTADELKGKKIEALIPQRYKERHEKHRDDFHRYNPHSRPMGMGMSLSGQRKDGSEFPVEVSLSVFKTEEAEYAIAFVSDITVRKQSEDALVKLNSELEQIVLERTRSLEDALEKEKDLGELKSRFVSMASHQFRTPLSTVLSSAYLISQYKESADQAKRDRHIERITSSVNLLNDILNDFLSVGKIEEGHIQVRYTEIPIATWMENVLTELKGIAKPGQELRYAHDGGETVLLDPALFKQIVQNLVANAIKFSPENEPLDIQTSRTANGFSLTVADLGIGISEEDQRQLFQRFFRGTNATNIQGTGLGLHIVAKFAELMSGSVEVKSTLGKGTIFIVSFAQGA